MTVLVRFASIFINFKHNFQKHQEINADAKEPLHCVLVRSDQEAVVVNLDLLVLEDPKGLHWVDAIHPMP